jgi:hypothetical protein
MYIENNELLIIFRFYCFYHDRIANYMFPPRMFDFNRITLKLLLLFKIRCSTVAETFLFADNTTLRFSFSR